MPPPSLGPMPPTPPTPMPPPPSASAMTLFRRDLRSCGGEGGGAGTECTQALILVGLMHPPFSFFFVGVDVPIVTLCVSPCPPPLTHILELVHRAGEQRELPLHRLGQVSERIAVCIVLRLLLLAVQLLVHGLGGGGGEGHGGGGGIAAVGG